MLGVREWLLGLGIMRWLMLIAKLLLILLSAIINAGPRQSLNGFLFALHVLISMLSVQPTTVHKKPWSSHSSYPRSWMIISSVMLHMSFVGTVYGILDWNSTVVISKTREAILFTVMEAWYDPPSPEPPDRYHDWTSTTAPEECLADHIHLVLHHIHFAAEYTDDEATSLHSYLDLTHWHLRRITPAPAPKFASHHVQALQCDVSCVSSSGKSFEILFDAGATHSFTHDPDNFISEITPETISVGGFLRTDAPVLGSGTVQWQVLAPNGKSETITTEAYYVPSGQRWLFCPQHHFQNWERKFQATSPGSFTIHATKCRYIDNLGWSMDWNLLSLPVVQATTCPQCQASPSLLDPANTNLTGPQKEHNI
jgi:hypothetical protein